MRRRTILLAPALALLTGQSWAFPASSDWRSEVDELRFAHDTGPGDENPRWWPQLGVNVRHLRIGLRPMVDAVDKGQVEFGRCCSGHEAAMLEARLGDRLVWFGANDFVLRSLPLPIRRDIMASRHA